MTDPQTLKARILQAGDAVLLAHGRDAGCGEYDAAMLAAAREALKHVAEQIVYRMGYGILNTPEEFRSLVNEALAHLTEQEQTDGEVTATGPTPDLAGAPVVPDAAAHGGQAVGDGPRAYQSEKFYGAAVAGQAGTPVIGSGNQVAQEHAVTPGRSAAPSSTPDPSLSSEVETLLKEADDYRAASGKPWRVLIPELTAALRASDTAKQQAEQVTARLITEATKAAKAHAATTELLGRYVIRAEDAEASMAQREAEIARLRLSAFDAGWDYRGAGVLTHTDAFAAYLKSQTGSETP